MSRWLALALATSVACAAPSSPAVPDKDDARVGGKSDGRDWCALYDWYGDGVCDEFCALPDPDCDSRADGVIADIEAYNRELSDADRRAKYCKMAASPFAFYRGTAHLFFRDRAGDDRLSEFGGDPSSRTWLQGDMHLANAGAFDDDRGRLVYDLNDFDEVAIADYQLDLWRLAISFQLLAGELDLDADDAVDAAVESYLDAMHDFRGNAAEESWQLDRDAAGPLIRDFLDHVADHESRAELLDTYTEIDAGGRHFDLGYRKLEDAGDRAVAITAAFPDYLARVGAQTRAPGYFAIKSIARRVDAGTGSLGTPRFYVLIEGPSDDDGDDRILDVKRQGLPAAAAYLGAEERALTDRAGAGARRVVLGHRALGVHVDDHLGWLELDDGSYSVRELSPYKKAIDTSALDADALAELASAQGMVLAAGHARADRDFGDGPLNHSVDAAIDDRTDGQHREMRDLVRGLAREYAGLVGVDYAAFVDRLAPDCN